ncbi:hypothetical protein M6G53_00355 [Serratia nevei]|uniref:hypothetical protein n=1 Tax=Serratia nevei TaxID=2703794 RepID=UPI00209E7A26|nr:hypothetical protein [Serratia nevei]MCP1103847.1 hypothetical protein [Serratia nevei]
MLTTALQQSIKIKVTEYLGITQYACTCYGDSERDDIFYVVPEIPVFLKRDTNTPSFMFYKYRSEDMQGGYAQFTVQLPQPNERMQELIRQQLYDGLGGKNGPLGKKSGLIVDYIEAKQRYEADPESNEKKTTMDRAQKSTGLSDEQLNRFVALYDPTQQKNQFLSELMPATITLMQPRYTSVKAMLILDGNDNFYRQIPTPLSPSGLGDNDTVFSLSLTGEGATLFEQVLKGTAKNTSVSVRFDLSLDASLSAAKVIVSYNSEQAKSVTQTINHNTWSADEKKVQEQFYSNDAIKVDVKFGLPAEEMGMQPADHLKWEEGLKAWGQQQVEQILSSQTGLDMSLDLLNDADGFDKFSSKLSQTQSFTREYEENAVVSFTIYPQTQLPSIRSIVGEAELDQYFKEYDLHDPFYQYIQPEFYVTEDMAKYGIANIVVTAVYDDDLKSTLTFTPKDPGSKKTDKWFIKPEIGRAFRYHYTVNFTGMQAKPYLSGEIQVKDDLVVTINAAQSGIVYADISTLLNPLGWGVFSQVVVKTQYEDKEHGVPLRQYTQVIDHKNSPLPFIYPIGTNVEKPLYYSADYYALDGDKLTYLPSGVESSPQLPGYGQTRANQILIANALPKPQKYTIIFKPSQKDVSLITFEMTVNYPKWDFSQTRSITLTESDTQSLTQYLTFNLMQQEKGNEPQISYIATVYYGDNQEKTVTKPITSTSTIVVVTF